VREAGGAGWRDLVDGHPWFSGTGRYPIPAYSEFMPPPRVGRTAYGEIDPLLFSADDPFGWRVSELEEECELRPGLESIGKQVIDQLVKLGRGESAHRIAGHKERNLRDNPYWPPELGARAGKLHHERFVILLPLALSKTQDDLGRVRWTLFGSSEQGPERAFWKSFYRAPGQPLKDEEAQSFILRLLSAAYGEPTGDGVTLGRLGFHILPSLPYSKFPYWVHDPLPAWTRPYVVDDQASFDAVRYLLTFRPFAHLPESVKESYLAGKLALIPFPGSLTTWGIPTYLNLQAHFPLSLQLPLLQLVARHGGPDGLRVPQSGWIREARRDQQSAEIQEELLVNSYARTSRWDRVHRNEDEIAASGRIDHVTRVLFSSDLDSIGLYDKPEARNCQLLTEGSELLLDGPQAGSEEIKRAEETVLAGGLFRYRFLFPAMRVGEFEVYWQRPLIGFLSSRTQEFELVTDAPTGYLTAYRPEAYNLANPVEIYPRVLRREPLLAALREPEGHGHFRHQLALNLLALLDSWHLWGERTLPPSFARQMLRLEKRELLGEWLQSLGPEIRQKVVGLVETREQEWADPFTFDATATRAFEIAFWDEIARLSAGSYRNKDNADCVADVATQSALTNPHRDLEQLGDYLLGRHRQSISEAGMEGKAVCGELSFQWRTDMDYPAFGGWKGNQEGSEHERDLLVVIPGKNRSEAVVLADHYDTAYEEDVYDRSRGGSGARLAAAGADDNASATATLLLAAPIFLRLANEGKLERDVWLLHLTGEEFPADCLGARHFCEALVEKTLSLDLESGAQMNLTSTKVAGVLVMDMIAHNRESEKDIFQISPGRGAPSLRLAWHLHAANMIWNANTVKWNSTPDRQGKSRGERSLDGAKIPDIALHPRLDGQVRTVEDPQSSLYNTDGQIFSDAGVPVVLMMENYDINRSGYHDTKDTLENIDLDYGAALSAIAIEAVAQAAAAVEL
jgi:Peptidase family M28